MPRARWRTWRAILRRRRLHARKLNTCGVRAAAYAPFRPTGAGHPPRTPRIHGRVSRHVSSRTSARSPRRLPMTTLSTAALVVVAGALVWIALSGAALDLLALRWSMSKGRDGEAGIV